MRPAPILGNDSQRLKALHTLLVLDTPPEERFDRIVSFASMELNVPISLISLVDENRQWFKSRVGLDVCETARDVSFCGHAIGSNQIFVVEDTHADEAFFDNPLVTGDPFIRFYAGAPLILSSGHAVGTLCLLDTKPRKLDNIEMAILSDLRDIVVYELELRTSSANQG